MNWLRSKIGEYFIIKASNMLIREIDAYVNYPKGSAAWQFAELSYALSELIGAIGIAILPKKG